MRAYFIRDGRAPTKCSIFRRRPPATRSRPRYRALARANHPDRLMGEGASPAMIKAATVKAAAINAAYEQILAARESAARSEARSQNAGRAR